MNTIHKVIFSCEEATKIMLQQKENTTFLQRIRIKLHFLLCDGCKRFNIQNKWIDSQLLKIKPTPKRFTLDVECKKKIQHALNTEMNNNPIEE